ncbi:hypothetical protein CRP01_22510 [Flavilitoribacter nigricans DSM 23189 = NBRC 102662]|uniref:Uncharacterized protein n=2 Tax=Flavilitoribacter TaxID=2762562 RepID=A0A2D0N791_FLAN2|nr:hypothetical protein CRP01_22510 [Flavilitoribacter nigricans DSM 23189 = NBRC 102662]
MPQTYIDCLSEIKWYELGKLWKTYFSNFNIFLYFLEKIKPESELLGKHEIKISFFLRGFSPGAPQQKFFFTVARTLRILRPHH